MRFSYTVNLLRACPLILIISCVLCFLWDFFFFISSLRIVHVLSAVVFCDNFLTSLFTERVFFPRRHPYNLYRVPETSSCRRRVSRPRLWDLQKLCFSDPRCVLMTPLTQATTTATANGDGDLYLSRALLSARNVNILFKVF